MELNDITGQIINSAMRVHTLLGPGLLEQCYQSCLQFELAKRNFKVFSEVALPGLYDGARIELACRLDLLVQDLVIIEIKSVKKLAPIHSAQTLSYLKLSPFKVALLINFNVLHLKNGIKRFMN